MLGSVGFVLSELVFRGAVPGRSLHRGRLQRRNPRCTASHDESEQCQGGSLTLFVSALDGGSNHFGCSVAVIAFPSGRKR
jgi:hypothetical protein